jgi:PAS domain S-box-containing protein
MASHPGEQKRHYPVEAPVAWDPIRRALEENEDWCRDLVEHSRDLLCVHDLEGRFLSVNPVPARLLGYSEEELLARPMRDFIDPRFARQFDDYLREIEKKGEARGMLALMTRTGEQRIWEYHNTLRTEGVERPIVRGMAHDVTERVRAEKALRATNEQLVKTAGEREQVVRELALFRTLLDQSNDAIYVVDPETRRFLDVNEKACWELGYSREELLSMTVYDIDANFDESSRAWLEQQVRESGFVIMERVHRRKDGTTFPVEVNQRKVRVDREYCVAVSRDITARKLAEERLREFERVVENLEDMILVLDRDYRYVIVNPAFLRYWGMRKEQVVGHLVAEVMNPKNPKVFETVVKEKLDACFLGKVVSYELRNQYPGMGERDVSITYLPVESPAGIDRVACVLRDITERKQAEQALRESAARERARAKELETVLEVLPIPVVIAHDAECLHMTANRMGHEHLRMKPGANPSMSADTSEKPRLRFLRDGVEIPADQLPLQRVAATGLPMHDVPTTIMFEDGTERHELCSVVPLLGEDGKVRGAIAAAIDITERKRAEEGLRASEERLRLAQEVAKIGTFERDFQTGESRWSPEMEAMYGLAPGEFPKSIDDFLELVQVEDRPSVARLVEQSMQAGDVEGEWRVVWPDGTVHWIAGRWRVFKNELGRPVRILGMDFDITERKRAEEAIATLVQVRGDSSENFFASMASQLAKCLEADYTAIGELIEGKEGKLRTIGVCGQGVIADNFTYELADTPCGTVVEQGTCSYAAGVTEIFPKDLLLKQMQVEGYVGTPLRDSQGRAIGIMVALYRRPLANAKFAEAILQLFSTRTAAEIERKRAEGALRQSEERFRVALKHSPIAVFHQDRDLRYTWMYNPLFTRAVEGAVGKTTDEIFSLDEAARTMEVRRRVLEAGVGARHEIQITDKGRKMYLDVTIEPVSDSTGAVIGLTGAATDVTALREANEALREAKKKLTEEKIYLEQEIDTELGFGEIIGQSKALQALMENVGKVAGSDATVLLLGETGTGKELVARAIHRLSQRAGSSFIKTNCAAIPSGLLESELFGNERGAFTGAVSKKIGRLELADKGTLFLDEIGEISLALQPKLLRVLQDQEFERLGGIHTLKVDFRLIAATNRDLADCVRENEFRSDLYYRLNVFPIRVPPLRERREDIPLLVEHFVRKCGRRMNRSITSIPKKTMDALMGWEWPGNVRELENFIERSVILTQGSVLVSPLSELRPISAEEKSADESLEAAEREHILRALRESHGQIGGLRGAAMRLGLKRTTLQSKLKHLGINPRSGAQ